MDVSALTREVPVHEYRVLCLEGHYRDSQHMGCVQVVLLDIQTFHALFNLFPGMDGWFEGTFFAVVVSVEMEIQMLIFIIAIS